MNLSTKSGTCHQNPKIVTNNDFVQKQESWWQFRMLGQNLYFRDMGDEIGHQHLLDCQFYNENASLHKIRVQTLQLFHKT